MTQLMKEIQALPPMDNEPNTFHHCCGHWRRRKMRKRFHTKVPFIMSKRCKRMSEYFSPVLKLVYIQHKIFFSEQLRKQLREDEESNVIEVSDTEENTAPAADTTSNTTEKPSTSKAAESEPSTPKTSTLNTSTPKTSTPKSLIQSSEPKTSTPKSSIQPSAPKTSTLKSLIQSPQTNNTTQSFQTTVQAAANRSMSMPAILNPPMNYSVPSLSSMLDQSGFAFQFPIQPLPNFDIPTSKLPPKQDERLLAPLQQGVIPHPIMNFSATPSSYCIDQTNLLHRIDKNKVYNR